VFSILWAESINEVRKRRAKKQWEDCYLRYQKRESTLSAERILASIEAIDEDVDTLGTDLEADSEDELYVAHGNPTVEPEWKRWIKEPLAPRNMDIFKYWQAKQFEYPIIAQVARDHLAIPATSAPAECIFSQGSDIITKKRNRLAPATLRELLCLKSWGVIEEEEDSDGEGSTTAI
jgi:hypothetical protein